MNLVDLIALTLVVLTSFAATNLDNLLILVLLLGSLPHAKPTVLAGFLSAVGLVILVSGVGVILRGIFNAGLIDYLGFAPLFLGCFLLYQQYFRDAGDETLPELENPGNRRQIWLTTLVLLFSNSGDSIAVLLPLMAETERELLLPMVGMYLFAGLCCCGVALAIAGQPQLTAKISRYGGKLVPWVMIAVGLYILADTGTDTFVADLAMLSLPTRA